MNWTKRIILAVFLVLLTAGSAFAQDVRPLDSFQKNDVKHVRLLLMGYHDIADEAALSQVADAPEIVESMAAGPHGVLRDRALAALGRYWPSADVFLLYAKLIAADDTPEGTRHRLLLQFADAFGERALPAVAAYLEDSDVRFQITAAQALARIGTDEALSRIDAYAERTDDPVVLEQLDEYVKTVR